MTSALQSASRYRDLAHAKKDPSRSVEQCSFWSKNDGGAENTVTPVNEKNSGAEHDFKKANYVLIEYIEARRLALWLNRTLAHGRL